MKSYIYLVIIIIALGTAVSSDLQAQGCVAVKNMSSCSLNYGDETQKGWTFSVNYRYFRSYKHFRGKEEEENRVEEGSEVINNDNSIMLGALYNLNNRWAVSATVPLIYIDRSSLYEHYGNPSANNPTLNPRFHTQSQGFGDARVSAYYSLLQKSPVMLSLGFGVKLPTGNYNVKDYFHKRNSEGQDSLIYKVVDQSIQLGDGGFGFSVEFDATYFINNNFSVYGTGFYLFNPRNTNGVLRSTSLTNNIPLSNEFSVSDQFLSRVGVRYNVKAFQFGLGGRYEGIPSEDLIGDSDGFRRPGYIVSLEPSIAYSTGKHSVNLNLPVALERNRTQNTIDKERTKITGTYQHGDAAFADWLLSISYSYRLGK